MTEAGPIIEYLGGTTHAAFLCWVPLVAIVLGGLGCGFYITNKYAFAREVNLGGGRTEKIPTGGARTPAYKHSDVWGPEVHNMFGDQRHPPQAVDRHSRKKAISGWSENKGATSPDTSIPTPKGGPRPTVHPPDKPLK
jgi:hypothetical protein